MIISRAPLRISFMGGGSDLSAFYEKEVGRVISTAIDKYIYLVFNHTPMVNRVTARYFHSESVNHPLELKHDRIREALLDLGIKSNIEIGAFAHLPSRTGLGSSSSFSVALMKGLHAYLGKKIGARESAEAAARLETDLLKEPIGKQDHYAAAAGGFNVLEFHPDRVEVQPVLLDFERRALLEESIILFYTNITRDASTVLTEQSVRTKDDSAHREIVRRMVDMVLPFKDALMKGNLEDLGALLSRGWQLKRQLASNISNPVIDALYNAALEHGAWGGKLLGAGAGGCLLFLAPPERHAAIKAALFACAREHSLEETSDIPVRFVQSGAEIVFNTHHPQMVRTLEPVWKST